jgi:dihydroorotate dehydrogenase (fumarate)
MLLGRLSEENSSTFSSTQTESKGFIMSKKYSVGGLELDLPIIVGAGVCKVPEQVLAYQGDVPVGAVVSGSYTLLQRDGNEGTLMWPVHANDPSDLTHCLNSLGMPNCGWSKAWVKFNNIADGLSKPLIINVAGFKPEEYCAALWRFNDQPWVSAIEFNFGCPNTAEHGGRTMSFDIKGIAETLSGARATMMTIGPRPISLWLKFSPYSDAKQLEEVAAVVKEYGDIVDAVVACNTFPNAVMRTERKQVTTPNKGRAGLSGIAMKTIALGQVEQWREHLSASIDVIGVGGVTEGQDVIDLLDAGAVAVQATSLPIWCGGPRAFQNLLLESEELQNYLS